jgi:hypothetical protein
VASHQYDADQLRDAGADFVIESLEEGLPAASLDSPLRDHPGG